MNLTDLTEFLLARIDDDIETGRKFQDDWYEAGKPRTELIEDYGVYPNSGYNEIGVGLGRWYTECQTKKNLVKLADSYEWHRSHAVREVFLRHLAVPYEHHADYQQEWRL